MKGTILKRGKTYTIYYYIGKNEHGKWVQKSEGGFTSKREAEKVLRDRIITIEASYNKNLSTRTVSEYLDYWFENYCEPHLAENTLNGYRINIDKHIKPIIGKIPLIKLTPKDIQDLYTTLRKKGLSQTSIRYVHSNLHKALAYAVTLQFIIKNPCDPIEAPKPTDYEAQILNPDQILTLLQACIGKEIFWPVLLAVSLGLRRGEALGLRWEDVDFQNEMVMIRHSAISKSVSTFKISDTKSKASLRTLLLPEYVVEGLKYQYKNLLAKRNALGENFNPYNVICFRENGQPFTNSTLQHQFRQIVEATKLPDIRFHDLRHTNATLLLRNGIPAKIVSAMLGHATIQITMDTYSHVYPDMQEGAKTAVNSLLNNLS